MKLLHTTCLRPLELHKRTIVSQPVDPSWPKDFTLAIPFCVVCGIFPPFEEIKKFEN